MTQPHADVTELMRELLGDNYTHLHVSRVMIEEDLEQGDVGTVVLVHRAGAGYEVEFATLAGETLAVVTVPADAVRPVGDKEIAHVRRVA